LAAYLASTLIPVFTAYLAAYRVISPEPTLPGLIQWVTYHSPDSGFAFRPVENLAFTIRGTFRLFFGGRIGDFVRDEVSWAMLSAAALAAVAFLVCFWRGGKRVRFSRVPLDVSVWAGCYLLFLFFWMPQNTFYRLFYLPALLAGIACLVASSSGIVWRFLPILLLWNLTFVIYPQSRATFNVPLSFAQAQRDRWPTGTPIVFHKFHPDLWTISYFNKQAAWISLERANVDELDSHLAYARSENRPLWLEATAYELVAGDTDGRRWLAVHERPGELLEFRDEKHHFQFHCLR
jgi:hypothetical protein